MDEPALIQSAQQGDLDAFNRLVLAYQNVVYSQAYRMMGEAPAADDATQETFITAFRKLNTFRGGSFRAWLLRIVTNKCYDELRRRQRQPSTPFEPLNQEEQEVESVSWMEDPAETPEQSVERLELARAIRHCLDNLPPEFRAAVILVDIQGLSYSDAAHAAGTPIGTVKSRLARARLRMRDCLKAFRELLPGSIRLVEESDS